MLRSNNGNHRLAHEKAMRAWRKSVPYNPARGHLLPRGDHVDDDEEANDEAADDEAAAIAAA